MSQKKSTKRLPATVMWLVILTWFCSLAVPLTTSNAETDKREIVRRATESYYSLRKLGLLEFKATFQPNWALMAKNAEANPEAMKMLNSLVLSVSLRPDGSVRVTNDTKVPIPTGQKETVKQLRAAMEETLSGFFLTWNLFMLNSPFPAVESEYEIQDFDGAYLLAYREGSADVSMTMTRDLAITEIKVFAGGFKTSVKPQLTKTEKGYVLVGYQATYEPTSGPGNAKLTLQLDYQEVNGLQLPRKLNLDATYDGAPVQMELQFSQYQLKLADSGASRKSN